MPRRLTLLPMALCVMLRSVAVFRASVRVLAPVRSRSFCVMTSTAVGVWRISCSVREAVTTTSLALMVPASALSAAAALPI